MAVGALDGIRVLDLTQNAVGQAATSQLGDLGADVISVTRPGYGASRGMKRAVSVGRSKRSLVLDLKSQEGLEIFRRLVESADVLVEGYRPGVADRLGIGYSDVIAWNERLVYCSITGYGQTGPYRYNPGHDLNFQGVGGALPLVAGVPQMPTSIWADRSASLNAEIAILVGLFWRSRSGRGCHIDLSIADSLVALPYEEARGHESIDRLLNGGPPGSESRRTPMQEGAFPCYNIYQCGDGRYLSLGASEKWFWVRFCEAIGRPDWAEDHHPTAERAARIFAELRPLFSTRSRDEWLRFLLDRDIPVAPINHGPEVVEDEQLRARGTVFEAQLPDGYRMHQLQVPFRIDGRIPEVGVPAVVAGQHSAEILRDLGYSCSDIDRLSSEGTIEHARL